MHQFAAVLPLPSVLTVVLTVLGAPPARAEAPTLDHVASSPR